MLATLMAGMLLQAQYISLYDVASPGEIRAAWRLGDESFRKALRVSTESIRRLQQLPTSKQVSLQLLYLEECERQNRTHWSERLGTKWDYGRLETIALCTGKKPKFYKPLAFGPVRRRTTGPPGLEATEVVRHKSPDIFPHYAYPLAMTSAADLSKVRALVRGEYYVVPRYASYRALVQRTTQSAIGDFKRLGKLRSEFGDPPVTEREGGLREHIWTPDTIDYTNRQFFPVGVANERFYLNSFFGGGQHWLALETKRGGTIRKEWYVELREAAPRKSIKPVQLRSMGTLEAYLARRGLRPLLPRGRVAAARILRALRARRGYAVYMATAVESGTVYCSYLQPDGVEVKYVRADEFNPAILDYPVTGFPYPVTPAEQKEIRSRLGAQK
jgi:hypothetical protein